MQIQGVDLITIIDPLSYACGIEILSGSLRQTFDKSDKSYNPDRTLAIPLVIMPWIGCYDSHNGSEEFTTHLRVTNVQYKLRRLVNNVWTETNLNATPVTGYKIAAPANDSVEDVTVSVGSGAAACVMTFPRWSLIVEENVPSAENREIEAHIFCIDPQTGDSVERVSSVELSTNTTEGHSYKLLADTVTPGNLVIDPLRREKDILLGKRIDTIGVQLYEDNLEVPDANAVYWWYFWENGTPQLITADNQFFVVSGLNSDGSFDKKLVINADYFNRLVIMCRAEYWNGIDAKPSSPSDNKADLKVIFNRSRRYSYKLRGNIEVTKGVKIKPSVDVGRRIQLFDRKGDLTNEEMNEHFQINWKSRTSSGVIKTAGHGVEVSNIASEYGVTETISSALIPTPLARKAYYPLNIGGSILCINGAALMVQNLE